MLELKSKTLDLKFNGEAYSIRFPSISQLRDLQKSEKDDLDKTKDLFVSLGLPENVFNELSPDHLVQIMESFNPPKN